MENLVFCIVVFGFIVVFIGRSIYLDRKKQALFEAELRSGYGTLRKRDYSPERFLRMDRFFRKHEEAGQLDDITWHDLGMDDIFRSMNHTYSAIGEEYLYYTLRSAGHSVKDLQSMEEIITYFSAHEDERVALQICMAKLGYLGKYSIYDYLDHLDYLGERSNRNAYIRNAVIIAFAALMPFAFSIALIGMLGMLILNNLLYFEQKRKIEPYVISFVYVIKLLEICDRIKKIDFKEAGSGLKECLEGAFQAHKAMKPLRKGEFWVLAGNGSMSGNPAELMVDYLKMAFHVDLICFNRMLSFLRGHTEKVDQICTALGYLETCIAVGAVRKGMEDSQGYAVPELWEFDRAKEGRASLKLEEGYHPLLSEPVKNSIRAEKGVLITGSNASGKSTFLKMVAINAVLAQTIHTCTAKEYGAPMFDIFSSMALQDNLQGGDSYYMVEIKALKRILTATSESRRPVLCFVDEVLRGTNTVERIAASTQILISLGGGNILCFAATHDIELTELLDGTYENYHFTEDIIGGDIVFQYRLLSGKATSRNAIKLLEIMGYDEKIITRAEKLAGKFLEEGSWT